MRASERQVQRESSRADQRRRTSSATFDTDWRSAELKDIWISLEHQLGAGTAGRLAAAAPLPALPAIGVIHRAVARRFELDRLCGHARRQSNHTKLDRLAKPVAHSDR